MMKTVAAMLVCLALAGCAPQVLNQSSSKGYAVGQRLTAPVGGTLLVAQNGTTSTVRKWVGILNAPDGWKVETVHSPDYLRKELVYSGLVGNVIEISYREYRGGYAAPAFYQQVKYDLNTSKTIVFQNFQIQVHFATNEAFEGTLLRD